MKLFVVVFLALVSVHVDCAGPGSSGGDTWPGKIDVVKELDVGFHNDFPVAANAMDLVGKKAVLRLKPGHHPMSFRDRIIGVVGNKGVNDKFTDQCNCVKVKSDKYKFLMITLHDCAMKLKTNQAVVKFSGSDTVFPVDDVVFSPGYKVKGQQAGIFKIVMHEGAEIPVTTVERKSGEVLVNEAGTEPTN